MSVSSYGTYVFVICFCDFTSGGRILTLNTNWELAAYEQVFTAHRDRPEQRTAAQRRMTQWSQRKGADLQYLLPKGEKIAVGIKEQVLEQVRDDALRQAGQDLLLSLKRTGLGYPA